MSSSSSVQFSCSVVPDPSQPYGLQHARPPCPSPIPGVCSNSCSLNWWCHPTISSPVVPFSSRLQSFPASESFQMSQFSSGGQSIGVLASVNCIYIYKGCSTQGLNTHLLPLPHCRQILYCWTTTEAQWLITCCFLNIYLRLRKWC